jgi:hypothetical protein
MHHSGQCSSQFQMLIGVDVHAGGGTGAGYRLCVETRTLQVCSHQRLRPC